MKAERTPNQAFGWNVPWWLSMMAVFFIVLGFFGYLGCAQRSGAIVRGVHIDRIALAGLTRQEAGALLKKRYESCLKRPIVLVEGDLRPTFVPKDLGISLDYDGMVDSAYRFGHQGSLLQKAAERLFLMVRPQYLPLKIKMNHEAVDAFYKSIEAQVNVDPMQIKFTVESDGKVLRTPSRAGKHLNKSELTRLIKSELWKDGDRLIAMPVQTIRPKLVEGDVEEWSFDTLIGVYTTRFNARDADRSHNVWLASAALDNCVVGPGETFSFNKQVGPRVAASGYREAPVIIKGKLEPGIGGGVCQVSGTLYNALLFGGFSKFGRSNHSLPSAYVPIGRDATVVYGGQDFTFVNTLKTPVLITTQFNPAGYLTVAILGKREGDFKIRLDSIVRSTIPFHNQEVEDPTLPAGERKVEEEGKNGYQVEVWRTWFGPDKKVIRRELISMNFYPPMPCVVKVGTLVPPGQAGNPTTATNASVVQTEGGNAIVKVSD